MRTEFKIGNWDAFSDCPPYILAEIGINHNGNLDLALKTIDAAKSSGVHGVKFQSYFTREFLSKGAPGFEIFEGCELSVEDHKKIAEHCQRLGIDFISTPLCPSYVRILSDLGVKALKVASGDLTFYDLIERITGTGLPLILSTGMASLGEIEQVVTQPFLKDYPMAVLHCISNYPPRLEDTHLQFLATLKHLFSVPVGFSDHSLGTTLAVGSVALGARLIEKHFTLDKNLPGPDHKMSLDPKELSELVRCTQDIYRAMGQKIKPEISAELPVKKIARRGLYRRQSFQDAMSLNEDNAIWLRPANQVDPTRVRLMHGDCVASAGDKESLSSIEVMLPS
ncbi:MAG: N-acetylneuraminate synthase family protein [Candidatus Cloacimonetes bacterium]|nr:N-acetylneuraminate synthase family protein [Candidatus Cloacimonadota bacterium]